MWSLPLSCFDADAEEQEKEPEKGLSLFFYTREQDRGDDDISGKRTKVDVLAALSPCDDSDGGKMLLPLAST